MMRSIPRFDSSARSGEFSPESGRALGTVLVLTGLVLLGWIIASLWIPNQSPEVTKTPQPEVITPSKSPAGARSRIGSHPGKPSSLDALSAQLLSTRKKIDEYFLKTQWDAAMDASTAHRVGRARDELEALLSSLGPEHVPLLIGLLEEEPDFVNRRFLLRALGRIGSDEALAGLVEHYWWCAQEQKESEVKYTIDALAFADTERSFEILREYALSADTITHRYRFVGALAEGSRSADAIDIYSQLLKDDSHFRVRQRAAYGLKVSGSLSQISSIENALQSEMNPYVRQSILGAIGGIRDVRSIPLVSRILEQDQVLSTRLSAIRTLLRIEGTAAIEALQAALNDASQPQRVRDEAQRALGELGVSG
ncbi:MAG: HEAT repeat domain-containing protein [Planctomycetes bacterium]|nr:HEAT repeat domain-containing protein [Planctomycetota bacterium]